MRAELLGILAQERVDVLDPRVRVVHERRQDGPPAARVRADREAVRAEATVLRAGGDHRPGGGLADRDSALLGRPVRNRCQRGGIASVERRLLCRDDVGKDAVRRRCGGRVLRVPRPGRHPNEIGLVAAVDRVDGVEDGAVHHREVDRRDGGGLPGRRDQRVGGVDVPIRHGVRASGRGGQNGRGGDGREQAGAAHAGGTHVVLLCTNGGAASGRSKRTAEGFHYHLPGGCGDGPVISTIYLWGGAVN